MHLILGGLLTWHCPVGTIICRLMVHFKSEITLLCFHFDALHYSMSEFYWTFYYKLVYAFSQLTAAITTTLYLHSLLLASMLLLLEELRKNRSIYTSPVQNQQGSINHRFSTGHELACTGARVARYADALSYFRELACIGARVAWQRGTSRCFLCYFLVLRC